VNEKSNTVTIGFRTRGIWTTNDLTLLSTSIGNIYDLFLTKNIFHKSQVSYWENLDHWFHEYEKYIDHPIVYDSYKIWKETLSLWRKTRLHYPLPPFPPFNLPDQAMLSLDKGTPDIEYIFNNLDFYSNEHERLQVYRIRISSPGGFSFQGIGKILKEIREMVKDLWYRNNQEKTKGELEIIKRYLDICRENEEIKVPLPKYLQKRNILIDETYKNIKQLRELESQNKLDDVGENIDYIPE
jgi:hypothetical protein